MNNVKIIGFSANVNALGHESGFGKRIALEDFPIGTPVCLNQWLPDAYLAYFNPITLIRTESELTVESSYITSTIPLKPYQRVELPPVGLSYATCQIDIYVE